MDMLYPNKIKEKKEKRKREKERDALAALPFESFGCR